MNRAKVSLGLINKNDSKNLGRLLEEMRSSVEEIVVVDTGSTDNSVAVARKEGADLVIDASDLLDSDGLLTSFGKARQRGLEACSQPWFLWLDTDDTLQGRELLSDKIDLLEKRRLEEPNKAITYTMMYEYSWNDDRSLCTQKFFRERIVYRTDGWFWKRAVHEHLETSKESEKIHALGMKVVHLSQGARGIENNRNLRILERWLVDGGDKEEPATLFYYLGDEHLVRGNYAKSAEFFAKAVEEPHDFWKPRALFRLLDALYYDGRPKEVISVAQHYGHDTIAQNAHIGYQVARAAVALKYPDEVIHDTFTKASQLPLIPDENPTVMNIIRDNVFIYGQKIEKKDDTTSTKI